ncbi:tyrosine-type recombinase/integrase [Deinococcus soli (ex Cha et al. 2016)]|uniref:Tyr recombinase domain-containing protein n=1 Tax=Deinococcus soli (ex Cha et al. 2016) TaxID=1309411 RepID=A0A0F7JM64_9DEIO|nr:site-specific integrase [Deinococcus soli (ex Cha et al. 2016)]AKH15978.1 hypothetical protein SY84_01735 [Deinococcus soli (ex Cha et al. 2016)]
MPASPTRKRARHNGEGSLRKRPDGTWEARYTLGRDANGKQVRKSVYGRTRAEAADKLKTALNTHAPLTGQTDITLADYMARVATQRVGHVSARTSEIDQHWIKYTRAHPTGQVQLQKIRVAHLEDLYRHLATEKSRSVVMHVRTFINMTLKQAVKHDLIISHPGVAADLPRMEKPKVAQVITADEVATLLEEAQKGTGRWYPLIFFAVTLGLRHGEILGLQWQDVNLDAGELQVRRAISTDAKGAPRVTKPKTKSSARTLYLSEDHIALLQSIQRQQQEAGVRTALIFCTHDGQPLRQGNVRREFLTLLSRCGLPHLRIHDLRHTFATHLIGSGFDPKTVGDLMGHSDPRMTLEIYTHAQENLKKRAALQAAQIGKPGAGSKST